MSASSGKPKRDVFENPIPGDVLGIMDGEKVTLRLEWSKFLEDHMSERIRNWRAFQRGCGLSDKVTDSFRAGVAESVRLSDWEIAFGDADWVRVLARGDELVPAGAGVGNGPACHACRHPLADHHEYGCESPATDAGFMFCECEATPVCWQKNVTEGRSETPHRPPNERTERPSQGAEDAGRESA